MPDVTPDKTFETYNDPRDHSWVGSHRVFPTRLVRIGRHRCTCVLEGAPGSIVEAFEAAPVEYLEPNEVKMDRVGVVRQVYQVPNFHRIQDWIFRDGHIPMSAVEQHCDWVLGPIIHFDER